MRMKSTLSLTKSLVRAKFANDIFRFEANSHFHGQKDYNYYIQLIVNSTRSPPLHVASLVKSTRSTYKAAKDD